MIVQARRYIFAAFLVGAMACPLSLPLHAAPAASSAATVVRQTLLAGPFKLALIIGPLERMYTMAQVAASHPKSGEVMLRGTMTMADMSMGKSAMPNHHLELHVILRTTNKTVSDVQVAISILSSQGKLLQAVPIAVMRGVTSGPGDTHFGNNVSLKDGRYRVRVKVAKVSATFAVTLSSSMAMPGM